MGDVAMTVPVIKNALDQHPQLHVTVVSNAFFAPLFENLDRCHFYPAELKGKHKGIAGLHKLFKDLKASTHFDAVTDFHDVLRSKILRNFFRLRGFKIAVIDKGRKGKKELTRKENKVMRQLATSHERYAAVLKLMGIYVVLDATRPVFQKKAAPLPLQYLLQPSKKSIGFAPFAQHEEKMYPLEKMKSVVKMLAADNNVLLFGGGATESATLQQWADEIPLVQNVSGKFSFAEELAIISNLHLMVSMDSANMHLASLFNVPVVSIWGATHPFAGFYGWAQEEKNIVSVDLSCRPCSVFGNKPCWRGDHACMQQISENMVMERINSIG